MDTLENIWKVDHFQQKPLLFTPGSKNASIGGQEEEARNSAVNRELH